MSWTLISTTQCPPGEFFFVLLFHGQEIRIPKSEQRSSPLIGQVADGLVDFRRGNGLKRATVPEALEDIITFTCKRLGNNTRYCLDSDLTAWQAANIAMPTSGCAGCGAKV